jgi:hypothetical protein
VEVKNQMVEPNQKDKNLRWLVDNNLQATFKSISKFGIPFLLLVNVILDWQNSESYFYNYDRIVEVSGYGLIGLIVMAVEGFMNGKCIFYYLSLVGLGAHNLVNIYFFGNYKSEYFKTFNTIPETIILAFVIVLIIKEKK